MVLVGFGTLEGGLLSFVRISCVAACIKLAHVVGVELVPVLERSLFHSLGCIAATACITNVGTTATVLVSRRAPHLWIRNSGFNSLFATSCVHLHVLSVNP